MSYNKTLTAGGWLVDPIQDDSLSIVTHPGDRLQSMLGAEVLDFAGAGFLPPGASFSGAGTYNSLGRLAVQSTGTIVHNPTGWRDGTACLEFTPNQINGEFRLYFDNSPGLTPLDFFDDNGIALEFEIVGMDTLLNTFAVAMAFSNDAANPFPANRAQLTWWRNDNTAHVSRRESVGVKYVRQRFDAGATDATCGSWPGYPHNTAVAGTGATHQRPVNYLQMIFTRFSGQVIKLKRIRRGGWSKPCIVLGTDNITPDTLAGRVAPLMSRHRIKHYANQFNAALIASPASRQRMDRLYKAGYDVCLNDIQDRAMGETVTDVPTMRAGVEGSRDYCLAQGWARGNKVWIANNNSTSYLHIAEMQRAGVVACRLGVVEGRYSWPEGGVPDPYRIPSISLDRATLATAQPIIDRMVQYGATLWAYYHGVVAKADVDNARTHNLTGTAGAPIAVNAGETTQDYRARALALGTAVGTATVAYMDARVDSSLAIWFEDLEEIASYIGGLIDAGTVESMTPTEWLREAGVAI